MKNSLRCPKCDHRKLLRIERVKTRGHPDECELPVAVTKLSIWTGNTYEGHFDAFVCRRCGYTRCGVPGCRFPGGESTAARLPRP